MTERSSPTLIVIAVAVLVVGSALMFVTHVATPDGLKAGALDPPHAAPEFSLSGSDGSEVTLARYRGKVVLLTFGFTHCAAVCPTAACDPLFPEDCPHSCTPRGMAGSIS